MESSVTGNTNNSSNSEVNGIGNINIRRPPLSGSASGVQVQQMVCQKKKYLLRFQIFFE